MIGYLNWIEENSKDNGDNGDGGGESNGLLARLFQFIKRIIEAILSALNPFN